MQLRMKAIVPDHFGQGLMKFVSPTHTVCVFILTLIFSCIVHASNPIVLNVSIADPHIRIFDDTAYMYAGKDGNRHPEGFEMPEWHVWRSHDLVHWDDITTILPSQTYMEDNEECWATDIVWSKDAGHYAFFFSHGGISMGVMTATSPTLADAKDVLGRPLVSSSIRPDPKPGITVTNLTRGAYDPTLLVDDATDATYVCFGVKDYSHTHCDSNSDYLIARLHPNLTALAEASRKIVFLPNPVDNSTLLDGEVGSYLNITPETGLAPRRNGQETLSFDVSHCANGYAAFTVSSEKRMILPPPEAPTRLRVKVPTWGNPATFGKYKRLLEFINSTAKLSLWCAVLI